MATLKEIYKQMVEVGISFDPRGEGTVRNLLKRELEKYKNLPEKEKSDYDLEKLENPYADTRILNGNDADVVKSVIVGIDIESPEIMIAHSLRQSGRRIDAAISHHPEGRAYARFYEVMGMQADILNKVGVPINVSESLTLDRKAEVSRKVAPANHQRAVDAAKLLNIPFLCIHTPADNMVSSFLSGLVEEKMPECLGDVLDLLVKIPEYELAKKEGGGPFILIGDKEARAGKIFVDMTGGTEGSKDVFASLQTSGVGTIIAMHMSEEHFKKAKENHINAIIAGHISSDNLGLNLLFDEIEKKIGAIETIDCSGFRRINRPAPAVGQG